MLVRELYPLQMQEHCSWAVLAAVSIYLTYQVVLVCNDVSAVLAFHLFGPAGLWFVQLAGLWFWNCCRVEVEERVLTLLSRVCVIWIGYSGSLYPVLLRGRLLCANLFLARELSQKEALFFFNFETGHGKYGGLKTIGCSSLRRGGGKLCTIKILTYDSN